MGLKSINRSLTVKKWGDVIFLSVVAYTVFYLIFPFYKQFLEIFVHKDDLLVKYYLVIGIITLILAKILYSNLGFRIKDICIFFKYPAIWIMGMVTAILFVRVNYHLNIYGYVFSLFSCLVIFSCFALFEIISTRIYSGNKRPSNKEQSQEQSDLQGKYTWEDVKNDSKALMLWINDETPIESSDKDFFRFKETAKNIAALITGNTFNTFCLTGSWGSGKSSILNMIEESLPKDKYIVVRLDGWGRRNDVDNYLLEETIFMLSKQFDCLGLREIPESYHNAIQSKFSWWIFIRLFFDHNYSPDKILSKIDIALQVNKLELVIYIEDIDRNHIKEINEPQLLALLDRLSKYKNINLVMAQTSKDKGYAGIDMRIFNINRVVPVLKSGDIIAILKLLLIQVKDIAKDDKEIDYGFFENIEILGIFESYLSYYISKYLNRPRMLKACLREVIAKWKKLHGEICYEDVFFLSVIQHAHPQIYSYIINNIESLKGYDPNHNNKEYNTTLKDYLSTLLTDKSEIEDIVPIISYLFPITQNNLGENFGHRPRSQGISKQYRNYFEILMNETIEEGDILDQDVFRAFNLYKNEGKHSLIEFMYQDDKFMKRMSDLYAFGKELLFEIITDYLLYAIETPERNRESCEKVFKKQELSLKIYDAFGSIVSECINDDNIQGFSNCLTLLMDTNLYFGAYAFMECIDNNRFHEQRLRDELKNYVSNVFNNPKVLITALEYNNDYMGACSDLLCCMYGKPKEQLSDWQWFVTLIINAAENEPVIIYQLVGIVVDLNVGLDQLFSDTGIRLRAYAIFNDAQALSQNKYTEKYYDRYLSIKEIIKRTHN